MSFLGLHIALSALRSQQQAMSVTAHNIANANTRGFHRQEATFVPGSPLSGGFAMTGIGNPQLGTGVSVAGVVRMQSAYVDQQVRMAHEQMGTWSYRREQLAQVESIFAEPGELGLSASMNRFWNSWEELTASPESESAKIAVVEQGAALSERIRTLYEGLRSMQSQTDQDLVDNVSQVNRLAHEIAHINEEAKRAMANGYQPNDLMDRRDLLIEELSAIAGVQVSGSSGSDLILAISGKVLVQGYQVNEIKITPDASGWSQVTWVVDGSPVRIDGGQMAGQLQVRDEVLQGYVDSLNVLAQTIVEEVNLRYSTGVNSDGSPAGNFFAADGDASNIAVEAGLMSNPVGLATSTSGNPGANDLVQNIAGLRTTLLAGGETIDGAYLRIVARVGAQSRESISRTETYTLTLQQLSTQRESISGVSLDEEMLNMARFQQAYGAAARVATTIDEMVDTIINRLGVVGR